MSQKSVAEDDKGRGSQPSDISEAVIRIAGNSQDGIQSIGGFLARLAGRSEQEVMTMMTIPSTISGGPSIFQVRLGTGDVLSPGDDADVLLAFTSILMRIMSVICVKVASLFTIAIILSQRRSGSKNTVILESLSPA